MSEEVNGRKHHHHAEAVVLSGNLQLPLVQEIKPQAHVKLHEEGGYLSERSENYRLEGVISVRSAYTHVAGNRSTKPGQGWTTLTTTVVEGLNVMEILTADRIVGQTITEHPLVGYVPSVNFLGTRFENLRVAGHPVKLDLDLNILGAKPADDGSYALDSGVLSRVRSQYTHIVTGPEAASHLEVAISVASGQADTGLGVRAAATAFDLGFVPVAWEDFDIVLSGDTLPAAEPLIAALRTSAVQSSIDALGGYDMSRAGSVEMLA